jgi:prolyl 4-hydroxylase
MMIEFSPFILGNKIDESVCDQLLEYFHNSQGKTRGIVGGGNYRPEIKQSTDLVLSANHPCKAVTKYLDQLSLVIGKYIESYPWCSNGQQQWRIQESFNIQMYKPGQSYQAWHCERPTATIPVICRHLVFMTYLNDLKDQGGETEWYHQKLKIKPEKGLTLIWPVDWPFTHRGIPSMTETKYITTGWYSYY